MHHQVAMERPHTGVVRVPLDDDIRGIVRRARAQLLAITALRIARIGDGAIPGPKALGQNPEVELSVQVHVVHDWEVVVHNEPDRRRVTRIKDVPLGMGWEAGVPVISLAQEGVTVAELRVSNCRVEG